MLTARWGVPLLGGGFEGVSFGSKLFELSLSSLAFLLGSTLLLGPFPLLTLGFLSPQRRQLGISRIGCRWRGRRGSGR